MSEIDGGPAFAEVTTFGGEMHIQRGMSLRDYFAAAALPICTDNVGGFEWEERTAQNAYKLADAMLKARES